MHLLWAGTPVPAQAAALGDLLAQWAGWDPVQSLAPSPPPDGVLLDWSPAPPDPRPDVPLLWIARRGLDLWRDDVMADRPKHLRPATALRATDVVLAQAVDDAGPAVPYLREERPVPLPRAIVLAHGPERTPLVVGLQARQGHQPALYVGTDLAALILRALGAGRERALAMAGHPVAGLFMRTGEPEHLVKFPWVNHGLTALRWCGDWLAREARTPRVSLGRYPEGKRWALALSHDVDVTRRTMVHVLKQVRHAGRRATLAVRAGAPGRAASAVAEGMRTCARGDFLAIEECVAADEALGVRSSFYFYSKLSSSTNVVSAIYDPEYSLGEERMMACTGVVVDRGCEVGLHGSYRSHADVDLLRAERDALEQCVGRPVVGVRQHFLQGEAPGVWRVQAGAGLAYDSSWSYRDRAGFRAGLAMPYRPWDGEEDRTVDLWELPLVIMDGQLFDRECATDSAVHATLDGLLDQLRLSGGAGAADWHQRFFADPAHPWRLTYERMVQRAREGGAWLGPCGALVDWWRSRAALRWTTTRDGSAWCWRVDAAEPMAQVTVEVDGVRPESFTVAAESADMQVTGERVVMTVRELSPDRPLEFRAEPAA